MWIKRFCFINSYELVTRCYKIACALCWHEKLTRVMSTITVVLANTCAEYNTRIILIHYPEMIFFFKISCALYTNETRRKRNGKCSRILGVGNRISHFQFTGHDIWSSMTYQKCSRYRKADHTSDNLGWIKLIIITNIIAIKDASDYHTLIWSQPRDVCYYCVYRFITWGSICPKPLSQLSPLSERG